MMLAAPLDAPYPLSDADRAYYADNGYVKLKGMFPPSLLAELREALHAPVAARSADAAPLAERTTYGKAFLQVGNLWTESDAVRAFVFGRRLARVAAALIGARGVRLYHDQALYKEAGGGITPWHADQYYWPMSSERTVTAWVPLQAVPREMGPLCFSAGSHRFRHGRDLEISDESELTLKQALDRFPVEDGPFELGEVSFHAGWTFHRAGTNTSDAPREVMTIIYMDEAMRLAAPVNRNQQSDAGRWCPGVAVGDIIASPLNPVIWPGRDGDAV